jgi:hypothetical protein
MTTEEAQAFIAQLQSEKHIKAEMIRIGRGNRKSYGVHLLLTAGQRTVTIKQPDEWPSVKQAWSLFV